MRFKRFLWLAFTLLFTASVSAAEQRVALVIGNAGYDDSPLRNPVNDSRAVALSLRHLGFQVIESEEADRDKMTNAVRRFARALGPEDVGLFYYAGHGVQVDGNNFLIPIGAAIDSKLSVQLEALDVAHVLKAMESTGSRLNIVILDACRNNPYERSLRGQSRGLAAIDAAKGTLIAYATAPGEVAADGDGKHGVYTEALLDALVVPGLHVEEVFKRVRILVAKRTNGNQIPWESSSLIGDFMFKPPETSLVTTPSSSSDELYWASIKDSNEVTLYQSYINRFADGIYVDIARFKLDQLGSQDVETVEVIDDAPAEDRVAVLLAAAGESLSALRLTMPKGSSAFDQYSEVLVIEPDNAAAQSGINRIADKYITMAGQAIERKQADKARLYLDRAESVTPGNEAIALLRDEMEWLFSEPEAEAAPKGQSVDESSSFSSWPPRCTGSNADYWHNCWGSTVSYGGFWQNGKPAPELDITEPEIKDQLRMAADLELALNEAVTTGPLPRCVSSPMTVTDIAQIADWDMCQGTATLIASDQKSTLYVGEFRKGLPHGNGKTTYPDGENYVGEVTSDIRNGKGVAIFPDGEKYIGEWKDDQRDGWGINIWADGQKYIGEWKGNLKHGWAVAIFSGGWSGDKYVGEFKNDKYHGHGVYYHRSEGVSKGSRYVGEYRDGKMYGKGTYYYGPSSAFPNAKYVGGFKDNMVHGEGVRYYDDGRIDEGVWENGQFSHTKKVVVDAVEGTFDKKSADAEFSSSLPKCKGTNADNWNRCWGTSLLQNGNWYMGTWKDGLPFSSSSNAEQSSSFSSSLPKCVAKYWWTNCFGTKANEYGGKYVGEWRNGEFHGQGTYSFANGDKYVGEWQEGKRHRQGTFTSADGSKFVGMYRLGQQWDGVWYNQSGKPIWTYLSGRNVAFTVGNSKVKKRLPECKGSHDETSWWHYCVASHTYNSGVEFKGEWRSNRRWNGTLYSLEGKILGLYFKGKPESLRIQGVAKPPSSEDTYNSHQKESTDDVITESSPPNEIASYVKGLPYCHGSISYFWDRCGYSHRYAGTRGSFSVEYRKGKKWHGVRYRKDGSVRGTWLGGVWKDWNTGTTSSSSSNAEQSSSFSSSLPKCKGWAELWNNCYGTRMYHWSGDAGSYGQTGDNGFFEGEFRNGKRWSGEVYDSSEEMKGTFVRGNYEQSRHY